MHKIKKSSPVRHWWIL